jgi:hypothetical protein
VTTRDELHDLLDGLPEADLPAAAEALRQVGAAAVQHTLDQAPLDDEPDQDDFDGQLTQARQDAARGRVITTDELRRRLQIRT